MQLYAITSRRLFASRKALLDCVASWASGGVDYVQIREKDLEPSDLASLATEIVRVIRSSEGNTRVLLNGPAELAIECGCDGVHLPSGLSPDAVDLSRAMLSKAVADPVISVSCHTIPEMEDARNRGATMALFAPVFEKRIGTEKIPGLGLNALSEVCLAAVAMPVFALGGVTEKNAQDCTQAGAAGIAAIRLFASENWRKLC